MNTTSKSWPIHYNCTPETSGATVIIVTALALPFHIMMIKILGKDVELSMPRHKIMFCLSISDTLQIFVPCTTAIIMKAFALTTESAICRILRDLFVFSSALTIVVASLSLATLAIERMIICMYFLKYQRLFPRKRTRNLLWSYWLIGVTIAAASALTNDQQRAETILSEVFSFQILCILFIFPAATIIAVIQVRLFLFSRERMVQIIPNRAVANQRNVPSFRKRQLKIAFVAGVVSVAYIVCMVPVATMFFLELVGFAENKTTVKPALLSLAVVNTLVDPFIYGLGLTQTRQIIMRNLRSILPSCITRSE